MTNDFCPNLRFYLIIDINISLFMFYDFFATSAKYSTEIKELVPAIRIFLMHAMHCRKNSLFCRANHMWNSLPGEIQISYNLQHTQKLLPTLRPIIRFRSPIQITNPKCWSCSKT